MFIPSLEQARKIADEYGTPVFVTDARTIRGKAAALLDAFSGLNAKIFYAIKANYNPHIIKVIKESGVYGIDAVSPNEVRLALELGYGKDRIIFTPSNPSDEEILEVGKLGVLQNLGSLSELRRFGKLFSGADVSVRICPEVGAGESAKVTTGQSESKFGVSMDDFGAVEDIRQEYNLRVAGLHSHIGSGFYEPEVFKKSVEAVCSVAERFSNLDFLDFGGGFGVRYRPDEEEINLKDFADAIRELMAEFEKKNGKSVEIRIEPGKFLVSQSTVLLAKITTVKEKNGVKFAGLDSGFYHLIRPAMYGAYHHVVNVSNPNGKKEFAQIVGNVCETCDIFNKGIEIAEPREGDILAILAAGGYGSSMSSNYNLRGTAPEILIDGDGIVLTKKRQTYEQIMDCFADWK